MSHIDKIKDADAFFEVNRITRQIVNRTPNKIVLMQKDHNSERFTFSLPRYIEGHDMSESKAKLHYINAIKAIKGMYEMKDLRVDPDDSEKVICSWLISGNVTKEAGALSFMIEFECYEGDVLVYSWHTQPHNGISVGEGFDNAEEIAEMYADVLQQWHDELFNNDGIYEKTRNKMAEWNAGDVSFDTFPSSVAAVQMAEEVFRSKIRSDLEEGGEISTAIKKKIQNDNTTEKTSNKIENWDGEVGISSYPSTQATMTMIQKTVPDILDVELEEGGKICVALSFRESINSKVIQPNKALLGDANFYPSMPIMKYYIDNATNNVLKGVSSGEIVTISDISPTEHNVTAKAKIKNFIPYPYINTTQTVNGIKYTDNKDGTVTINGCNSNEATFFYFATFTIQPGSYILSGCPEGGSFNKYYLYIYEVETKTYYRDFGSGVAYTTDTPKTIKIYMTVQANITMENQVVKPMLKYATDVSSAKIITFGRNLFKTEGATLGELLQDGITTDGNASYITTDYIPVFKGMKGNFEFDLDGLFWDSCFAYDENLNFISSIDIALISLPEAEEDFPDGTRYIRFVLVKEDYSEFTQKEFEDFKNSKCQLVLGEVNKQPYEPYNGFMAYPITSDGTVEEIKSIYPTMTIVADIPGMVISADYNRDINKAFAELQQAIISLGGNV